MKKFNVTKKQLINGAIALTIGLGAFVGGFLVGHNTKENTQAPKKLETIQTQEVKKVDFVKGTFTDNKKSPSGNDIIDLTDGSFICHDVKNDTWSFTPADMGDWDIDNLDSDQAQRVAQDYINTKNKFAAAPKKDVKEKDNFQIGDYKLTTYTDGSYSIENAKNNEYDFYPAELDGWGYHTNDKVKHDKQMVTYLSIQNTGSY